MKRREISLNARCVDVNFNMIFKIGHHPCSLLLCPVKRYPRRHHATLRARGYGRVSSRFSARGRVPPFEGSARETVNDTEVYIRYFPSDRTFARRTERTREGGSRQLWESDVVGFAISCSGCEMAKPLNSLRQRERQYGTRRRDLFHDRA